MPQLRSLPENATLLDVIKTYSEPLLHLNPFVQSLMRGPSPFTPGQRELFAAFVSGLNGCFYCHGVHSATAVAFGVDEDLFEALMNDVDSAPVEDRLKPVLHYIEKLTKTSNRMVPADADAVYDAGWDDTALFHAVAICAYFNMMNRLVDGSGVKSDAAYHEMSGERLAELGYTVVKKLATSD